MTLEINEKKFPCDYCGRLCSGGNRLQRHETACQRIPPEVRVLGEKARIAWLQKERTQKGFKQHKERPQPVPDGKFTCDYEGCGLAVLSPQGLGKHRSSCKTRTPAERTEILPIIKNYRNYGGTYRDAKRRVAYERLNNLGVLSENGISPFRIEPTPMFQEEPRTELTISFDTKGLLGLATKVFPELLSLMKFERLERK